MGPIGISRLALGLRGKERWLGARRELEGGHAGSGQGGFHRWSVGGVAKLSRGYLVSTRVEVPREMESMIMEVLGLLVEVWKCR